MAVRRRRGDLYASFLYTAPESGTTAQPPLSSIAYSPSNGTDAWILGTGLAVGGFVCFAINLIVTVSRLRAPGLAWRRMPPFTAAATVIAWLLIVIGPVMLAALTMLTVDRHFNGVFYDSAEGGAPLLYQHLSYIFLTGTYLIIFLAAAGAISEILPTFARKPLFSRRAVSSSFVAVAVLGLMAWMQNMYIAPLSTGWTFMAMAFALALLVPIGLLLYSWIATIWGGALELRAATWYALLAVSTMACGLAGELAYSVIPVGWALDFTTASQGDTLYVLVGGAVIGGFAALHYWFPKLSGRLLGEGVGKFALLLMVIGIHLYVLPMFLAGLKGQPVDIFKYYEDSGLDTLNLIASIGAFVLVLGILVELGNAATAGTTGSRPAVTTHGAGRRWSGSRSRPRRRTTSTPSPTCVAPSRCTTSASRSGAGPQDFTPPEPLERVANREPEPEPVGASPETAEASEPPPDDARTTRTTATAPL